MAELQDIAHEMGIEPSTEGNAEELVYAILDRQAEIEGNKNPLGTKRRRTRITKKDTDRVYTVNGKDGENFDVKKNKADENEPKSPAMAPTTAETATLTPEEMLSAIPKHRGRKSKKELELLSAIQERKRRTSWQPSRHRPHRPTSCPNCRSRSPKPYSRKLRQKTT